MIVRLVGLAAAQSALVKMILMVALGEEEKAVCYIHVCKSIMTVIWSPRFLPFHPIALTRS